MYRHAHWAGADARQQAAAGGLFGPGWPADLAVKVEVLELWATGIKDPGADYCEWRAFDEAGKVVATRRVDGY